MSTSLLSTNLVAFPTQLGWMAILFSPRGVRKLTFGYASEEEAIAAMGPVGGQSAEMVRPELSLVGRLQDYSHGRRDDFQDVSLDLAPQTPFRRCVYQLCRRIPFGRTLTYGELAARAGSPAAARAVGGAMAANQVPLIIPCHRVVPSPGGIGGFSGPGGLSLKRRLLDLEAGCSTVITEMD